jgi:putative membrane protein
MTLHDFPALNAGLNGTAAVFLTAGFILVKRKNVTAHRAAMLAAFAVSVAFLACYLAYHLQTGAPTPFGGLGWIRPVYFAMLISHILLAMAIVPLILVTLTLALRGRFDRHRAWARWTFPLWYYVSVTGVLIYFFLYQWWPAATAP